MTSLPLTLVIEPANKDGIRPTEARADRAFAAAHRGETEAALRLARAVAKQTKMSAVDAARVANVFTAMGAPDEGDALLERLRNAIDAADPAHSDDFDMVFDCGHTLAELKEADAAIPVLKHALVLRPTDARLAMPLLTFLLQADRPDEVIEAWLPMLEACHDNEEVAQIHSDTLWSLLIRALSYFGYKDHALELVEQAKSAWLGAPAELADLAMRASGQDQDLNDTKHAIAQFDSFAEVYDKNLSAIGNRGPALVARVIHELDWPQTPTREILDAGCGTGLCAPILRPYAKVLHGCDLSIGMLEKSKERGIFDLLTRTDLNNPATYPDAMFDTIIVADVFVYFGDLVPVLKTLSSHLKPGGWLIFSVEDATRFAPARGYEKHPSGRFRHMPDYVLKSLSAAGYGKPKLNISDALRLEFGSPVPGLCIATQKLSLVFG